MYAVLILSTNLNLSNYSMYSFIRDLLTRWWGLISRSIFT